MRFFHFFLPLLSLLTLQLGANGARLGGRLFQAAVSAPSPLSSPVPAGKSETLKAPPIVPPALTPEIPSNPAIPIQQKQTHPKQQEKRQATVVTALDPGPAAPNERPSQVYVDPGALGADNGAASAFSLLRQQEEQERQQQAWAAWGPMIMHNGAGSAPAPMIQVRLEQYSVSL
jgi:hypothetical protein